ncbi:hypothetical protein, partial [Enterococcus faecium]
EVSVRGGPRGGGVGEGKEEAGGKGKKMRRKVKVLGVGSVWFLEFGCVGCVVWGFFVGVFLREVGHFFFE